MLKNYLLIAYKVLLRRKFFTAISLFGISFTLMILVMATAFLEYSFSAKAPETKFDRTLWAADYRMRSPDRRSNWNGNGTSFYLVDHYLRVASQASTSSVENYSIFDGTASATTFLNGEKLDFDIRHTDGAYWNILDFDFIEGRSLTEEDNKTQAFVAVITESMRNKYFKGENAVGKELKFNGQTFRVVGVVKSVAEMRQVAFSDVWVPISTRRNQAYRNSPQSNEELMDGGFQAMFLARSDADFDIIKDAAKGALAKIEFPDPKRYNVIETMPRTYFEKAATEFFFDWETLHSKEQTPKFILAIALAAIFFMLLPTINLVNLNVSRIMERASEIGVRKAFGASAKSLVVQFLVENICLTVLGGIIGILLSMIALRLINQSGFWNHSDFALNWRVFAIGFSLTIFFGILSGVYPAYRMSKLDPVKALKGGK
jgi:putative ABC transport system permease protein